jgi:hypothetical protein
MLEGLAGLFGMKLLESGFDKVGYKRNIKVIMDSRV